MIESEIRMLAQVHGYIADMEAVKADIIGMTTENERRLANLEPPAYGEQNFFTARNRLADIADALLAFKP
jgi:hypothetical protein